MRIFISYRREDSAGSPRADDLPRSLYELSRRETYKLDATSFQSDIDRLLPRIQSLDPWRSFKAPERAPLMDGLWEDVLQVHWPVDPDSLISLVPKGLEVDTFDNQAWVTIEAVREATGWYRKTPWLQSAFRTVGKTVARIGVQDFSKMPVVWFRTPVRAGALPGWLILSVGAPSRLGTALVKAYSPLSAVHYRKVTFTASGEERTLEMLKHRAPSIRTVYRPFGEPQVPKNGSLEAFLCHRQLMFSGAPGSRRSSRVEVQFAPWSLQQVELTEMKQSFLKSFGLEARSAPLVYSATRISAAVWSPRPTDASAQPA